MAIVEARLDNIPAAEARIWRRHALIYWLAVAAVAAVGLLSGSNYLLHILILCAIWAILVASWDLVLGYAGIFNYAQLVFFSVGAYGAAMLSVHADMTPVLAIAIGMAAGGLFGLLIGAPCLRLKGEYIALFTFAVHLALPPVLQQGRSIGMGGNTGLLGIPPVELFGHVLRPLDKAGWFVFALVLASVAVFAIYFVILHRRPGRAFVALRDAPDFAQSLGVNAFRTNLMVFAISAAFAGLAGAIYAHYTSVVTPKILGTEFFLMAMVMLAMGGMGRFPGVLIGVLVVTIGNELLRAFGDWRLLILGIVVVLTIRFLPDGLITLPDRLCKKGKTK